MWKVRTGFNQQTFLHMKLKKTNEQPTRITNQLYLQITHGKAKEGENTKNIF